MTLNELELNGDLLVLESCTNGDLYCIMETSRLNLLNEYIDSHPNKVISKITHNEYGCSTFTLINKK